MTHLKNDSEMITDWNYDNVRHYGAIQNNEKMKQWQSERMSEWDNDLVSSCRMTW